MRAISRIAAVISASALALALAGCADTGDDTTGSNTTADAGAIDCAPYEAFGDLNGKEVTVYTSIVAPEDQSHIDSYKPFEDCTGAKIIYEGSKEFEAQLLVRVKGDNAPDIAYVPQPGLLNTLVKETGKVVEAPAEVAANVDQNWEASWKAYGSVDGKFYAAPLGANVKSFVWYSPKMFADKGYEVPNTWAEMMDLTEKIANDDPEAKPWCAGFGSGDATGWPGTDWLEDVLMRTSSPENYDKWVNHEIPFNDPTVVEALDTAGKILKEPRYVNGGFGDVKTIATTTFQDGGQPILQNKCYMHRQASFYAANWPAGTNVAEDGDVFAFYLPAVDESKGKPVLGGGEFVAAFSDRPEVKAFQTYLSSADWANAKAKATPGGGWVSANKGLDPNNLASPIDKLSAETLADPQAVFRFDGSDLMPGAVGAGTFWRGMTNWITGSDSATELKMIEDSWPA
ncbi:ABC transporter substrate-binding protein [Propionibacteriaceae bacterium Y1923]